MKLGAGINVHRQTNGTTSPAARQKARQRVKGKPVFAKERASSNQPTAKMGVRWQNHGGVEGVPNG